MFNSRPVQRSRADRDFLIMLLGFGISVVATRLFLEATGYPQVGNSVLHIAHAVWGGLLQFIAICILLVYANRWRYPLSAAIGGVGVGLFIDEIGKFITQSNDYFFPFAAPIIYASLVLVALLYLHMRRSRPSQPVRTSLYWALDQLKDVLDEDFDETERAVVVANLREALAGEMTPQLRQFTVSMLELVQNAPVIKPPQPTLVHRLLAWLSDVNDRYVTRERLRIFLIAWFFIASLGGLVVLVVQLLVLTNPGLLNEYVADLIFTDALTSPLVVQWIIIHSMIVGVVGALMFISAVLLLFRREALAIRLVRSTLIVQLTVVNLLAFYFNQFAMVLSVLLTIMVFFAVEEYRLRYLPKPT